MKWYPWLNTIYNQILNTYHQGRGHHALLLNSMYDNGEDFLIERVIRWLMCSQPCEQKCCDACHNCHLTKTKNHPDYYQLDPKKNQKAAGIDVMRTHINALLHCARQSGLKVVFIKNTEFLTEESTNALLKIIEEPPVNTYFFLKTREYMRIPMTLLSRCVRWIVSVPEEKLGLKWLMQQYKKEDHMLSVQSALRLCDGAPVAAFSMLKSNIWQKRFTLCTTFGDVILNDNFLDLLPFFSISHDNVSIYWLITLLMDALKLKQGVKKDFFINLDQEKLIANISVKWSLLSLHQHTHQWLMLFSYLKKFINIDRELFLIYRLLNWKQDIIESCFNTWSM